MKFTVSILVKMSKNSSSTEEKRNESTIEANGSMQASFDSNDIYYETVLRSFVNSLFDGFQMQNILQKCFKEVFDESLESLAGKVLSIEEKLQDELPSLVLNEFKKEDFLKDFTVLEEIDENYASGISEEELKTCEENSNVSFLKELTEKVKNDQRNLLEVYTELKNEQLEKEVKLLKEFLPQDDFLDGIDIG